MVNSKRITLNYELKDAGNTGVTGVELWCTQDTRTWKKGEIVAQTNHSYTVEVKDEGLTASRLLAAQPRRSRQGTAAARRPAAGVGVGGRHQAGRADHQPGIDPRGQGDVHDDPVDGQG